MRQHLKKQCLDTIDILQEAHSEIVNYINKKQIDTALDLLAQCQDGAISVGNTIESCEGEGTEEVHQLEVYCELLWQYSEKLKESAASVNPRKMEKALKKPLSQAARGIKTNLSTQREVVFLPYKASMWDSLESVWKKMDEDPDVTALVMPIPYYDKNPDGSFKEMHYEFDKFPREVPITGYMSYSLEERHPDAIYIHNPYDDWNYVTSVHPDYFSSNLKEYTDELVYIPYYVLGEINPDNKQSLEKNSHFIKVPGVINAHRVIVQSENWRKAYIKVLTDYLGKDTKKIWENKIEVGVSPKVERVRNLKAEDFELPEEWKTITDKSDGSRKKIIFYNTSVGAILKETDKMLDKIRRNLEIFRENSDEVTLLWRPHPLMESTLTSMLPGLWEEYKGIVEEYRRDGWGIYDDTPELDRAIAVSDAYYGDWSSVVWLYKETGKPIMIQNCEV